MERFCKFVVVVAAAAAAAAAAVAALFCFVLLYCALICFAKYISGT